MFEQIFKNVDAVLWKDAGCGSELDYVEQTSWVLFLKYIDDLEKEKETSAQLAGKKYVRIIAPEFQWNVWAVPKGKDGKLDHHKALTGDDLTDFVNQKLFPYLKKFKINAESADTIQYKIGEIFSELKNRIQSGYTLREVVNLIDQLRFGSSAEKHEMSHLYEAKIQNMGNAGRNGGEYYTPRPLIKTIVKVVKPKIGAKIYDGAVGSAGFLCEAFEYMKNSKELSTKDVETLQKKTFYGKEKKSLAYIIGIMNMIFHGIGSPNIIHTNTLSENITDIQEKDRYDVVMANPPFGGKERAEVQQNFPIKTSETAFLFLQHFIKILRAGGKAGIVIKNTFLSNTDNASVSLRQHLLENCNLHTILDMPGGTFLGAGVKTVVLFFDKGVSTKKVWYYQLNLDRNLGKTNPLNEKDLAEFVKLQKDKKDSDNSWTVNIADINTNTYDLSVKNPNKKEEAPLREPQEILKKIAELDKKSAEILKSIDSLESACEMKNREWEVNKLGKICKIFTDGDWIEKKDQSSFGIRLIQTGNVGVGLFKNRKEKARYISEKTFERLKCTEIVEGDCLISRLPDPVGRACILPNTGEKMITAVDCTIIRFHKELILSKWFIYYSLSKEYQTQINKQVSGATRQRISRKNLGLIKIPIPSLHEQRSIVAKFDDLLQEITRLESIHNQKFSNLEELKQSILQKTFKKDISEVSA